MKNTTERAKEIIFPSTTQIALPAEINSGGIVYDKANNEISISSF